VEAALQNTERYAPAIFAHFRRTIRVAALKPRAWGGYDDFSEPELPGSFFASVVSNPLELADHFIHEFQHNRLSCIEEYGPLFDATRGDAFGDARFYSPWRDKLRALYGLFHGVYVFIAVGRYWRNVHVDSSLRAEDRVYVVDRLLRLPRQLRLAVAVLRRFARLTPMGQTILEQFVCDVDDLQRAVEDVGLPADAAAWHVAEDGRYVREVSDDGRPLTVAESLQEHLRRNDAHQQCAGLLPEWGSPAG
jgi:HEXXH motif-containing protein